MEEKETIETTETETPETETETEDGVDYKAQLEQERQAREDAEADAKKWKDRAKGNYKKVNETKDTKWIDQDSIKKMVDESVWVVKFYSENKDANQYQEDIESLVAKGIARDKAFKYVIAEKDPSLLLDDAKKAQLNGNTALNWVPKAIGDKNRDELTDVEIAQLSDADFEKLFPSGSEHKKFYAEV